MKKFLSAALALFLIICTLSACGKTEKPPKPDTTDTTETNDISIPTIPQCTYEYTIQEHSTIVSETEAGGRNTKFLRFPVVSNMANAEIQTKVNAILLVKAENFYKTTLKDIDIYMEEGTIFNYEVTSCTVEYASDNFLSVKSAINFTTSTSEYSANSVYTTNIDLKTGEEVTGEDIFSDFMTINNKFIGGDFKQEYGMENLLNLTNYSDMILQYKSDRNIYPDIYFSYDKLIINIDLTDSLGSAAGFSIPLADVRDCLKLIPN
ncbi:MAG: hypothetical protein IJC32_06700 [Clostridia bacterium]|nr:hypothetical protein [Clostridia bacterium]